MMTKKREVWVIYIYGDHMYVVSNFIFSLLLGY